MRATRGRWTASKFAIHRFMNNPVFDWRNEMYLLNRKIKRRDGKAGALPTALILDDTLLEKAGRRIEGVSLAHDHCDGKRKYLLGGNRRILGELFREQVAREGRRILVERLLELFEDMLRTVATAVGRGGSATLADIFTAPEYDACMQGLFGQFLQNGGFAPCKKAA